MKKKWYYKDHLPQKSQNLPKVSKQNNKPLHKEEKIKEKLKKPSIFININGLSQ